MAEQVMKQWQPRQRRCAVAICAEAAQMRRRDLTKEEKAAIGEEILKGHLQPTLDRRAQKNAIRRAIDSVRPGWKSN